MSGPTIRARDAHLRRIHELLLGCNFDVQLFMWAYDRRCILKDFEVFLMVRCYLRTVRVDPHRIAYCASLAYMVSQCKFFARHDERSNPTLTATLLRLPAREFPPGHPWIGPLQEAIRVGMAPVAAMVDHWCMTLQTLCCKSSSSPSSSFLASSAAPPPPPPVYMPPTGNEDCNLPAFSLFATTPRDFFRQIVVK